MGTHKRMSRRSVTVKDVPADEFIKSAAEFLKRQPKFDVPKYHDIVKTGTIKEFAPYDEDWFYVRSASILRKVYLATASGAIIRKAMLELEKLEMMEHCSDGGRIITSKGRAEMDRIAGNIQVSGVDMLH